MKNLIIALLVLIALGVGAAWALQHSMRHPASPGIPSEMMLSTTTVTGQSACLPQKGNGPSTMECAFGMKADDGTYYALDWSGTGASAFGLPMGRSYSVTGLFVPAEALNDAHWQTYDIAGVIKVASYKELVPSSKIYPLGSKFAVGIKDPATVGSTTIRVSAVVEDSRCPSDVRCIQAGRVRIAVTADWSPGMSTTTILGSGKSLAANGTIFILDDASPYPVSGHNISESDYRFSFTAAKQ